jgi:hypothetical protein
MGEKESNNIQGHIERPMGLTREEHGDLNIPTSVYPGGEEAKNMKIDMLRALYQERGNSTALQQLDVYDGRSEYIMKFEQLTQAAISGDIEKQNTLLEWYRTNYPDIK